MAKIREHRERRNKDIIADFIKYGNEYKGRYRKYSNDAILLILADKYYLSERTIQDIVFSSNSKKTI